MNHALTWENTWKVKSNPNKSIVCVSGCSVFNLEEAGGISISGIPIQIKTKFKILGYTFDSTKHFITYDRHMQQSQILQCFKDLNLLLPQLNCPYTKCLFVQFYFILAIGSTIPLNITFTTFRLSKMMH